MAILKQNHVLRLHPTVNGTNAGGVRRYVERRRDFMKRARLQHITAKAGSS
jgi:hypothetical protein